MSIAQVFGGVLQRPWVSPGPTIDKLIASVIAPTDPKERHRGRSRVATGPVGSGKTTGVKGGTILNAMQQPVWPDSVRRYEIYLIRDTYRNLWSQFVPFWLDWWPPNTPGIEWSGAKDGPVDTTLHLVTPMGPVDYTMHMRAIGEMRSDADIENFWRGLAPTDIWLEEGDMLPESVYRKAMTRLGRYPARSIDGHGAVSPTLWMGSNQFLIGSWAYAAKMAGEWKPGVELFEQPGGRAANAENLHNLRPGYYDDIVAKSDERTVRRMVDNEHVLPLAGTSVYPEFKDLFHTRSFTLDSNLPLRIGFDGGNQTLNPAAAIGQRGMARQLRFKAEVTVEHGCGVERFAELVNEELGKPQYGAWARKSIICTVDPSAQWGADKQAGQANWIMAMRARTGLNIRPARTNVIAARREALRVPMSRVVDGQPGLLIDPAARVLREGLGGLFHFANVRAGLASRSSDTPAKNHHSHVCEAAEYMALDDEAVGEFEGRKAGQRRTGKSQTEAISD